MVDFSRGDARYHLLEATRQYAFEKARRARRAAKRSRSGTRWLSLRVAERLDRDWYDARERSWFRDAAAELDNFRAALAWSLAERRDVALGRAARGNARTRLVLARAGRGPATGCASRSRRVDESTPPA